MKKIMVVMVAMIVIFSISGLVFESNELQYTETTEVDVRQGDTLWNIAAEINDDSYNNHKLISVIKEMNEIDTVMIRPGQTLKVPVIEKNNKKLEVKR